jgi:hypothetical protein
MLKIPHTKELEKVAQRLIWFKSSKEALNDSYTFMAHVMTYGTLNDVLAVKRELGLGAFKETLHHLPPGIMDAKSWNYWNLVVGRFPAPPLPKRKFQ